MADTWRIRLSRLEVRNADEDDVTSDGDEPYLVTIGFRSKFKTPGSTKIMWTGHLDDDWANGIDGDESAGIPAQMGLVSFDDVERPTLKQISAGTMPEVLGAIVVCFESDATPFDAIRSKMRELEGEIRNQLVPLIEQGQLNTFDPGPQIQAAVQAVRDKVTPTTREKIAIWLSSFADPDEMIGFESLVFAAVDPSVQVNGVTTLDAGPLALAFITSGVDYRVSGQVEREVSASSPLAATARSYVNVVSRSLDKLDVFMTGGDGAVRTAAWQPEFGGWRGWWDLRGGRAVAGAAVTAVSRSADKLDVFVVGTNGEIHTAAWQPSFSDGWRGWWDLLHGATAAGAPITAVSRSKDKLDVFCVGNDGHVYTAAWQPQFTGGWRGWWRIGDVKAPAGSYVGVVSRSADKLDIFVTDVNGRIMTAAWQPEFADGWRGWWHVRGGLAKPGSPITAVSRAKDKLDIFAVGTDGGVYTAAWEPQFTDGWHGWWRIRDAKAPLGSYVGAVSRSLDKLDVFVTDVNGNILTAAWEPRFADGWHGWWHIKGGKGQPGTPVTAVSRRPDFLDVFAVGTDGKPWTAAWQPAFTDGWHGWWRIGG